MAILAQRDEVLNWIYLIVRLNKIRYNWGFYSAFFYKLKVTVESLEFSAVVRVLSSAARRFDKVVWQLSEGVWVGTQFSVFLSKVEILSDLDLRNSKSCGTRNLVLTNCQGFPSK